MESAVSSSRAFQARRELLVGGLRAVWNLARVERSERTLGRTLKLARAKEGLAFAREWTFADLYEWAGVLGQYTAWSGLQADPRTLLDKYRVNLCLLSAQSPMVHAMALLPAWKQVYADSNAVLLQRITPLQ